MVDQSGQGVAGSAFSCLPAGRVVRQGGQYLVPAPIHRAVVPSAGVPASNARDKLRSSQGRTLGFVNWEDAIGRQLSVVSAVLGLLAFSVWIRSGWR
jgi:hypothetical protein